MPTKQQTSRSEQKAATRETLKKAGLERFTSEGYARTKIGDITTLAGVAQGTFYVHYASKEELLDELLRDFNDGLVRLLAPIWFSPVEPDDDEAADADGMSIRINRTADGFLTYWEENRGFVEIYAERMAAGLTVETLRDGINPEAVGLVTTHLQALLEERGVASTAIDGDAVMLVVQGLLSMWSRIGLQVLFNPTVRRDVALETLQRMTEGALESVIPGLCGGPGR